MDQPTERDRLLLLEQVRDPETVRILESLPLDGSWRCLEIGAGMGSIAYWLAARCSQGQVVAVDIDTRNLDPKRSSNLNIQEDVYTFPVGASPYPAMNRYAAAVRQATQQRGADMQWGNRPPGIMAQLGFTHIGAKASPRLVGAGGLPDQLWRINLEQSGSHMARSGLLTKAELDECLSLLDTPSFVDIRYIGIAAWGQKSGA